MRVKTKYNVGDGVWVMKDNKPKMCKIIGVRVQHVEGTFNGSAGYITNPIIQYDLGKRESPMIYEERFVFPTCKKLLNSLLKSTENHE